MASKEEVFEKVQGALVDALGVDDDEVTETATLVGDLGAKHRQHHRPLAVWIWNGQVRIDSKLSS